MTWELPGPRRRRGPRLPHTRVQVGDVFLTDADVQREVARLDATWNALRVAVCGTARGVCDRSTAAARELGGPWVDNFEARLTAFREWRDDRRLSWFSSAFTFNSEAQGWQSEAEALAADVATATGAPSPIPSAPAYSPAGSPRDRWSWTPIIALAALGVAGVYLWTRRPEGER